MAERLGDWLEQGSFSLAMSSGFLSFYAHTRTLPTLTGVASPNLVAGSSAGALVGGAWAAGLEPAALGERLLGLRRDEFWDPAPGAGLLKGKKFDRLLRELLPIGAIDRCRVPVRISVFDIVRRKTTVLDAGELSPAIRASCAVPGLFHPVWIGRRAYWDGGILDRPGLAGMPDGERVLFHHIESRSPWRSTRQVPPKRAGMVSLVIENLPRSGPFKLELGHKAFVLAREATKRALETPIVDGVVTVRA